MSATVLIGIQWGDEGKGKIIDVLTEQADMVIRFQGGANAGHTVEIGDEKFVLHLIPSGVLREGKDCVIGNGVVVDALGLVEEIEMLEARGVEVRSRLHLSNRAQIIFNYLRSADAMREAAAGKNFIGTTKRGIGPAYAEKANRVGIRGSDLLAKDRLEERFRARLAEYNKHFEAVDMDILDPDAEWQKASAAADTLAPLVTDTVLTVNEANAAGKDLLFEGAQGFWLDIDFGTYPYVTSSNTSVGGACTGSGLAPKHIGTVWGVVKAYTTRVGEGPFPTELDNDLGEKIRQVGHEFGATTGRPRRCGWLDAAACRYAVMLNGVDKLAVTKLDVLDQLEEIRIGVGYKLDGDEIASPPAALEDLARVEPIFETVPGWQSDTTACRSWEDLPANAKAYVERMAELLKCDVGLVSTGPNRVQTFLL